MTVLSDRDRQLLLDTFLSEAIEHLHALEEGCIALEGQPDATELVHELFRLAHSLKGDATMVGFTSVAELAHALENLLDRLRDRELRVTAEMVTLMLQAVDALRGLVGQTGSDPATSEHDHQAVCDALNALALGAESTAVPVDQGNPARDESRPSETRTLRIDVAKLDRMMNLTGEIAIARGLLARLLETLPPDVGRNVLEAHHTADRLQGELQEQIMRARLVPIGPVFRQYTRTVRDLAHAHGKAVHLVIEGDDVEIDTRMVERLRDPLTHMIRNCIDHGLEPSELRAALGKPPEGRLVLRAAHEGGLIVITVEDDGAGFDRAAIAKRARAMGLSNAPEQLADADLLSLVFAPGFSTAQTVTELSGRGVGMDVVRRNIEALRGTITIASTQGTGSTITIRVPLTLAIINGFCVGVGAETYVLPLEDVRECLPMPTDVSADGHGRGLLGLRGEPLPYLRLRDLFREPGIAPRREHVVVVQHETRRVGLTVDELFGERQAVIKSLGKGLDTLSGVSGSTILGDGRVALILDVPALLREGTAVTLS